MSLPAYPELRLTGKIANISDALDPNTHTLKLRVVMDNAKHMLKPEMFATIRVAEGGPESVCAAGVSGAARRREDQRFVQNAAGKYDQRTVAVGRSFERGGTKLAEVLSGLNEGDKVVTTGSALLRPVTGD